MNDVIKLVGRNADREEECFSKFLLDAMVLMLVFKNANN